MTKLVKLELDLVNNNINDDSGIEIGNGLSNLVNLTQLDLDL